MSKTFNKNEEGVCPICGIEGNLQHGVLEPTDSGVMYPWDCPDCGASGEEHYDITFVMHLAVTDADGDEYEHEEDGLILCEECGERYAAPDYCFKCGMCLGCCERTGCIETDDPDDEDEPDEAEDDI